MVFKLSYKRYGEHAILIEWPQKIKDDILNDVLQFKFLIEKKHFKNVTEVRSAYQSLLIIYKEIISDFEAEVDYLKAIYQTSITFQDRIPKRIWNVPVCYHLDFALDIDELAQTKNSSITEIIRLHTEPIYTVCFIGFLPGFLYLSGLHDFLFTPRKAVPRLKVERGAVAIGGNQTGIYPQESPGGWHVIGNSPIEFFNAKETPPCFAQAGDQLKFYEVDKAQYFQIKRAIENKNYILESELLHD
jgi:inhibitor of KinA